MPDVFISYARRDGEEFVGRLSSALADAGLDVWVDLEDIPAASDWERDLKEGVLGSESLCFVISPGSVGSIHCLNELGEAESRNKRLLPVMHRPVGDDEVPPALRRLNWIPQRGAFEDNFEANLATLVEAIRTDQEALRAHTRWEQRAAEWEQRDRDGSLLARGTEMRQAEDWLAAQTGREPQPTTLQVEYVNASRRAASRRQRLIVGASLAALAISIVLGIVALLQRNEARDQRDLARSNELASAATSAMASDPELGLILALEAVDTDPTLRATEILAQAVGISSIRQRFALPSAGPVHAVEFSPDGGEIAAAGAGGEVLLSAVGDSEAPLTFKTGDEVVNAVAFSSDGATVATAGTEGKVRVFSTQSGEPEMSFNARVGSLKALAFSPDAEIVAAAGIDGRALLVDLKAAQVTPLSGHEGDVNSIEFDSSGDRVVTASDDRTARVWDVTTGRELAVLGAQGSQANLPHPKADAEFSPSGDLVATANEDGTATYWEAKTAEPSTVPLAAGDPGFVTEVGFDAKRGLVLTAGVDRIDSWSFAGGQHLGTYRGHVGRVLDVATDRSGDQLLSAGDDGSARLWDVGPTRLEFSAPEEVEGIDIAPDGAGVAVAHGGLSFVNLQSGAAEQLNGPAAGAATSVAYSPDASEVAIPAPGGGVAVVSAENGSWAGAPIGSEVGPAIDAEWSDDGSTLAMRTLDGVSLWSPSGDGPLGEVEGIISEFALSPEGDLVAVFDEAGARSSDVRILDPANGEQIRRLKGHDAAVPAIDFSADGERIATGSDDSTARIWDADTGDLSTPWRTAGLRSATSCSATTAGSSCPPAAGWRSGTRRRAAN